MRRWAVQARSSLRRQPVPAIGLVVRRNKSAAARQSVAELLELQPKTDAPENVELSAFIRSIRKQKKKAFAAIDDGSSLQPLQAVLDPEQAQSLTTGAAVNLRGQWVPSRNPDQQAAELQVDNVRVLGGNDVENTPIQKKYQSPEFLRTIPHLRPRIPHNALLLRLRSAMIASTTRFFEQRDFVQTHTPIITSSDCEGAGEVLEVNAQRNKDADSRDTCETFFGARKYLTVSSQLHLEALAQSVSRVWTLSPTFRAEKSDTARHLSEFYMLEAEECFITELEDVMRVVESLIKRITQDVVDSRLGKELESWHNQTDTTGEEQITQKTNIGSRWTNILSAEPWPRITYRNAIGLLQEAAAERGVSFEAAVDYDAGLQTEHERYLADIVGQGGPVFVTDYPRAIKPFYMAPSGSGAGAQGDQDTAACFDLLMPDVCEVVGGSMREHRLDVLEEAMLSKGLLLGNNTGPAKGEEGNGSADNTTEAGLDWYLDLRRYGSVPHGGFGLGFDRLLAYLAGVKNVRDVVTFPRWHGRCSC